MCIGQFCGLVLLARSRAERLFTRKRPDFRMVSGWFESDLEGGFYRTFHPNRYEWPGLCHWPNGAWSHDAGTCCLFRCRYWQVGLGKEIQCLSFDRSILPSWMGKFGG